jgi:TPR repeat protein
MASPQPDDPQQADARRHSTMGLALKAHLGSRDAQFSMAVLRWKQRRDPEAMWWARKAARKLPLAKVFLANLLSVRGDTASQAEAVSLVSSAAQEGCPEAQQTLASYYFHGEGVPKDIAQSHSWALKAAQGGRVENWEHLIMYYLDGKHCEPDVEAARRYCQLAAEAGHPEFLVALDKDVGAASNKSLERTREG